MRSPPIKKIGQGSLSKKISNNYLERNINRNSFLERVIPLPWELWPPEARLLLMLMVLWSFAGLCILGSASWWVASREMGDGTYFIRRQVIWLGASWMVAWLAISISLRKWLRVSKAALAWRATISDLNICLSIFLSIA